MPPIRRCGVFTLERPFRPTRPKTDKIIFLSCEGCVTEEEYFARVMELFSEIQNKIQFISVAEDAVHTVAKYRTTEQKLQLSQSHPKQLLEKMERFRQEKEEQYELSKHPDDEFWIVTDIDQNWSATPIDAQGQRSYLDEWKDTIASCEAQGIQYAVSNPFFELWLLLHHGDVLEEDKAFAVTETHAYEKTHHFQERLRALGCPMKDAKHIQDADYTREKIFSAVERAKALHIDPDDLTPQYLCTTVYRLLDKIIEMLPEEEETSFT